MRPFFVLVMLEYGRHKSVLWDDDLSWTMETRKFASSIALKSDEVRKALEFLHKHKYLSHLDLTYRTCSGTLAARPRRVLEEAS